VKFFSVRFYSLLFPLTLGLSGSDSAPSSPADQKPIAAAEITRADRSLAAGYKAMFTCSATFNGGKTTEQIQQDELSNIYADYKDGMAAIDDPIVNKSEKYVTVSFAADMPPRLSAWRPHLGCTALPPGATAEDIKYLPRINIQSASFDAEDVMWPKGDKLPNRQILDGDAIEKIQRRL